MFPVGEGCVIPPAPISREVHPCLLRALDTWKYSTGQKSPLGLCSQPPVTFQSVKLHGHFFICSRWGQSPMFLFPDCWAVLAPPLTFLCSSNLGFQDYPGAFLWGEGCYMNNNCKSKFRFFSQLSVNAKIYFFFPSLIPSCFSGGKPLCLGMLVCADCKSLDNSIHRMSVRGDSPPFSAYLQMIVWPNTISWAARAWSIRCVR